MLRTIVRRSARPFERNRGDGMTDQVHGIGGQTSTPGAVRHELSAKQREKLNFIWSVN
jgi:hypothetical protein